MGDKNINQQDLNSPVDIHHVRPAILKRLDADTIDRLSSFEHDDEVKGAFEPDKILDYSQLLQQVYFIGKIPFSTILEGIKEQFQNYINTEDVTNYVHVFYQQLSNSHESIDNDESEEYPQEAKQGLEIIHNIFIDNILHLFATRLFIAIDNAENIVKDDLQFIIQRVYEYFILNAKKNFKTVISTSINGMIPEAVSEDEYFQDLQSLMDLFSPLIQKVTPTEFLQFTGDKEMYDLYTNHQITGNFLRKYTPKLYQNEVFAVEIVNYATMARFFKEELNAPITTEEEAILQNQNPII